MAFKNSLKFQGIETSYLHTKIKIIRLILLEKL